MKLNNLISYLFENMDEAALRGFSLDILKKETKRLKEQGGYIEDISEKSHRFRGVHSSGKSPMVSPRSGISSANLGLNRQRWVRKHPMERRN